MNTFDNNFFLKQKKSMLLTQNNEIHFYFVNLNQTKKIYDKLYSVLSKEEQNYTKKYLLEKPKANFIVSQGVLRFLLSLYLDIHPEKLIIERDKNGKPFVIPKEGREIFFNKSHSGDFALYGFTYINSIGVDIEQRRTIENLTLVAEKVLTEKEFTSLNKVPENKRNEYFLKYWTCKEAIAKAFGYGLNLDFKAIELDISSKSNRVRILRIDNQDWNYNNSIRLLHPVKEYAAAFCLLGKVDSIYCASLNMEDFLASLPNANAK